MPFACLLQTANILDILQVAICEFRVVVEKKGRTAGRRILDVCRKGLEDGLRGGSLRIVCVLQELQQHCVTVRIVAQNLLNSRHNRLCLFKSGHPLYCVPKMLIDLYYLFVLIFFFFWLPPGVGMQRVVGAR